jgi:hypothetical protein
MSDEMKWITRNQRDFRRVPHRKNIKLVRHDDCSGIHSIVIGSIRSLYGNIHPLPNGLQWTENSIAVCSEDDIAKAARERGPWHVSDTSTEIVVIDSLHNGRIKV